MKSRTLARLVVGALPLALASPASAQPGPRPGRPVNLTCLEAARDGLIDDKKAEWLCFGARSDAPYRCYANARDRTVLGVDEAIELCRCARAETATAPVDCYEDRDDDTTVDDRRIIDACRPIAKLRLLKNCTPYGPRPRNTLTQPYRPRGPPPGTPTDSSPD